MRKLLAYVATAFLLILAGGKVQAQGIDNFANGVVVTVVSCGGGCNSSATSIVLTAGHGARLPTIGNGINGVWFNFTDYPGAGFDANLTKDPEYEVIRCTNRSTDTLTCTRNQESSGSHSHSTGGKTYMISFGVTAKTMTQIQVALSSGMYAPTFNSGGTTTCDWSLGRTCNVNFGAGNTTPAFSNPQGAGPYWLYSCQDATGGRTYTSIPATFKGLSQPDPAAGTTNCTLQSMAYDGTNYVFGNASVPNSGWYGFSCPESTAPTGIAGTDFIYCDSTAHRWKVINNNGSAETVATVSGSVANNDCPKFSGTGGTLVTSGAPCGSGGGGPSYVTLAADDSGVTSSSYANTGLTFSVSANTTYHISCDIAVVGTGTTGAVSLAINGPSSPTNVTVGAFANPNVSGTDNVAGYFRSGNAAATYDLVMAALDQTTFAAPDAYTHLFVTLENGANAGTFAIRIKTASGTATVKRGSACSYQ